ncbi:MAG: response regulator [Deltaproteobacteria bacterium]|nr:response regulator [Deltaproteobacteria bacterium]MBN2673513.1 response regulator [Deltaproteobacteria bacterium]
MLIQNKIRVLLIEDSPIIQKMVIQMLQGDEHADFEVLPAASLTEGMRSLQQEAVDVVILDLSLPESTGVETVSKVRTVDANTPIVVFTGADDDHLAMAAMHLGADDYLVKKEVRQGTLLSRTLRYTIEQRKAKNALNQYAIEMERLAAARAQQLVHQDRLASIGTMSAGIAHEIRGPLTYAKSNVEALQDSWNDILALMPRCESADARTAEELSYILEETPKMLSDIFSGLARIEEITNSLKQFSRKGDTQMVEASVEDCVDNALTLCTNLLKYGVEVEKEYHTQEVKIPLNHQKLVQVFVNLFYNAVQAMEQRGKIKISTLLEDSAVKVSIHDTGPGIPDDTLERIFQPFFTTKPDDQGTGLGLSICREIIHEHGGTISAENRDDGASFLVSLPLMVDAESEFSGPRA